MTPVLQPLKPIKLQTPAPSVTKVVTRNILSSKPRVVKVTPRKLQKLSIPSNLPNKQYSDSLSKNSQRSSIEKYTRVEKKLSDSLTLLEQEIEHR